MTADFPIDGAVPLAHWGVIRARGADAASFLQGQLTNDVAQLDGTRARLAGYCSAKGRLLASFVCWRSAPDELLLACHASVLAATLKRLSMFVLRARCKLDDATAEVSLVGVAGASLEAAVAAAAPWQQLLIDGATAIRLPDSAATPRALLAAPAPPASITLDAWRWLELQSGVAVIEAATSDRFVPQMINFELVGGVSFQKGCYPGQEVVARSQYRGTLKRRMFLFDVGATAAAGDEVFHSGDPDQPAGVVANAAPGPRGGSSLLAEIKLAAVDSGGLHLGAPDGPVLVRRSLPYALLAAAEAA